MKIDQEHKIILFYIGEFGLDTWDEFSYARKNSNSEIMGVPGMLDFN